MIKQNLSEDDTSAKFITPALYQAGWAETAIRRQVAFTAGTSPLP
jgi:type I site-specific restriction endonuclease